MLSESEQRFRSLVEETGVGVTIIDLTGEFTYVNGALAELLGHSVGELCGRRFEEFLHPDDIEDVTKLFLKAISSPIESETIEFRAMHKDGRVLHLMSKPTRYMIDDKTVGFQAIIIDITERKNAEEALRRSEERYRIINQNMSEGVFLMDMALKPTYISPSVTRARGYTLDELYALPLDKQVTPDSLQLALETLQEALSEVNSKQTDRPLTRTLELEFYRKDGSTFWSENTLTLLMNSNDEPAGILAVSRDITERKRAEEVRNRLAAIVESSDDAIIGKTLDGIITSWNKGAEKTYGYFADEAIGKPVALLVPPGRQDELKEIFERVRRGEPVQHYESERVRKDGRVISISLSVSPIRDSADKIIGASTIARDITQRKNTERALRESEERFRLAMEATSDGLWDWNVETGNVYYSPAYTRMLGYEPSELPGLAQTWMDLIHPDDRDGVLRSNQDCIENRIPNFAIEFRMRTKSGGWKWILGRGRASARDANGRALRMIGTHEDIAERKRAEDTLRESEERYHSVFENSIDAILLTSPEGSTLAANPAACRIFGRTEEELREVGRDGIVDSSDPRLRILVEERARTGRFTGELTFKRKDGTRFPAELTTGVFKDRDGLERTSVIIRDITDRKRIEEAVRESEVKYRALVEQSLEGIVIAQGPAPRLIFANLAMAKILGYTPDELTSLSSKETEGLVHPEDRAVFFGRFKDRLQGKPAPPRYEVRGIRKDGEVRWLEISSNRIEYQGQPAVQATFVDITERKRMEDEIRGLARFPSENPNPVLRLNKDGAILVANPASKLLLQEWGSEVGQVAPKFWRDLAADALSSRQDRNVEVEFGGRIYTFLVKPITNVDCVNLYGRDITERKRAEEALRRRVEELAALQATVLDITAQRDLQMLLQMVVERATKMLRGYSGGMYLCDPEKKELRLAVSHKPPRDYTGTVLKYGEGAAGVVVETGKPLIIDDYRTWPGRAPAYDAQLFTGVLTVPMLWHSRVTGAIYVLCDVETRPFTEADQELLSLFANHAAVAVENARLMEQERRHTTELEQLVFERTGKLAESERRFRELSDLLPQLVFEIDENGNVQYLNRAGFAAIGFTEEEISKGLNAFRFLAPAEHERATRGIQRVIAGEMIGEREFTVLRRDGTTFPAFVYTAPITREGKTVGLRGIAIDITERKRMEQKLRDSEERFRGIAERSIDGIFELDLEGLVTYVSPSVEPELGYKPEEVVGTRMELYLPESEIPKIASNFAALMKGMNVLGLQGEMLRKDGTHVPAELNASPIFKDGRIAGVQGIVRDITERRKMEKALRESDERYGNLLESMSEHIAVLDSEWRYLLANDALARSIKIPKEQLLGKRLTDVFPGIEKSAFFEAGERVMKSRKPASVTSEHTFEDGQTAWFETHIYPVPEGIMYVANDITGRKLADAALRESEERFRGIVDSSNAGYFFIDRDGRFQNVNDAWLRMHGYSSRDEVIGRHYSLTQVEADLREADSRVETMLAGVPIRSEEFSRRNKDGSIGYHIYSANPVVHDGRVVGLEGFLIDTTERKQMEERLLKSERLATVGETAAMVGHDLRNPLTGIATATYNLKTHLGKRIDGETREALEIIEQDIQSSDKIITDLLEYSREIHLDLREANAKSITKDALAHAKIPAKIRMVDSTRTQPKIMVDTDKIRRVFMNLIKNAIDAMPKGGTLRITSKKTDSNLEIIFADTGTGMTKETIEKIWSPLFTTKATGIGLGLPIAKRLVESHEGSITAESKAGKGSSFTVTLPIRSSSHSKEVRGKK